MNLFQVYAWAVNEFFSTAGFYVAEESETDYSFLFRAKRSDDEFHFSIAENETEISLTREVRRLIRELFPKNQKEILLADWRMLLERYRELNGEEDNGMESEGEEIPEWLAWKAAA